MPRSGEEQRMTPDRPHEFPSLGDSHLLLTGATGFLGQATLEKLLSAHPGVRASC